MGIRFFIDAGLSSKLAEALRLLGKDVEHIHDKFEEGIKDEIWLPYVGENKMALITKDKGIRRKPNEQALLRKYGVVAFYLGGSEKSGHDIARQLLNAWENMEDKARKQLKTGVAGAFRVSPAGNKIDTIF